MGNIHKRNDQLAAVSLNYAPEGAFLSLSFEIQKQWQLLILPLPLFFLMALELF